MATGKCVVNHNFITCLLHVHAQHHDHDHTHEHSHSHFSGHFGDEEADKEHMKMLLTCQYAPTDDLMMYSFVSRDALEFNRKCADLCIKHKQVCVCVCGS